MPLVLSKPDNRQRSLSFRHFVTDVLTAVSFKGSRQAQQELHLLAPISTFVGMHETENARVTPSNKSRVTPGAVGVASATDQKLAEATAIYRAIRRYLWRHRVCGHRACARYAMKSLWWDLDGEKTDAFCATALAFMRWRMHWEGRREPSKMSERPERAAVAYGLLGWISMSAPIPSVYWSKKFEAWLNAGILAAACFDSFRDWEERCATDERKGKIAWDFRDHDNYARRHWACSGRGTSFEPGLFFWNHYLERRRNSASRSRLIGCISSIPVRSSTGSSGKRCRIGVSRPLGQTRLAPSYCFFYLSTPSFEILSCRRRACPSLVSHHGIAENFQCF